MISDTSELKHTREEVLAKVRQIFPGEDFDTIVAVLDAIGNGCEPPGERVQQAVLKLSNGNVDKLLHYIKAANQDWRDVLYWAEYPNGFKIPPAPRRLVDETEAQAYKEQDRNQYMEWLYGSDAVLAPNGSLPPKAE